MLRRRLICVLALSFAAVSASAETALAAARQPASVGSTTVSAVQPTDAADVILLATGFQAGLRQGMICQVSRDRVPVAELVLVELRTHAAAGLITALTPGQVIRPGDLVTVKLQTN
jgi:hypothetical protein